MIAFSTNAMLSMAAATGMAAIGVLLWWLIRKKQQRVWLPTTRILNLPKKKLPRITIVLPPIIPFFCFVLSVTGVVVFASQLATRVHTPYDPSQMRHHILLDLSPSVSAQIDVTSLRSLTTELWQQLSDQGSVTLSTTANPDVYEVNNEELLNQALANIDFHRAGARLGTVVRQQLGEAEDFDRLIVISDGSRHSWSDFHWGYYEHSIEVFFLDVAQDRSRQSRNVYLSGARVISETSAQQQLIETEITRTYAGSAASGSLEWYHGNEIIAQQTWQIPAPLNRLTLTSHLSRQRLRSLQESDFIHAKLIVDGENAVALDNVFRVLIPSHAGDALLIAEPLGEMILDDPTHHLANAFIQSGIELHRKDRVAQPGPDVGSYPLWIVTGGQGSGIDSFCPKSLQQARLAQDMESPLPKVWLLPMQLDANYSELCRCLVRLAMSRNATEKTPEYCEQMENRNSWAGLLQSLGAKQLGGEIGDELGALAWIYHDPHSSLELVAFTIPLTPSLQTGINFARLPLIVRDLVNWQGFTNQDHFSRQQRTWPRLDDITRVWHLSDTTSTSRLQLTNVPIGESSLTFLEKNQLPPSWHLLFAHRQSTMSASRDSSDPLPIIKACVFLIIVALALEFVWGGVQMLRGVIAKTAAVILFIPLAALMAHQDAKAQVSLSLVGYPANASQASRLALEVSSRTSIELDSSVTQYADLNQQSLREPWLWLSDKGKLTNEEGKLRTEISAWLRRGGLLILEGEYSRSELEQLTTELASAHAIHLRGEWRPVPPDHELMRSFYLLEALPNCHQASWFEFAFDDRTAIVHIPYRFILGLLDQAQVPNCSANWNREQNVRAFINLLMAALTTDYKKDQIHLPEILKRLR